MKCSLVYIVLKYKILILKYLLTYFFILLKFFENRVVFNGDNETNSVCKRMSTLPQTFFSFTIHHIQKLRHLQRPNFAFTLNNAYVCFKRKCLRINCKQKHLSKYQSGKHTHVYKHFESNMVVQKSS